MCERLGGHQEDAWGPTRVRERRQEGLTKKGAFQGNLAGRASVIRAQRGVSRRRGQCQGGKARPWEEGGQALAGTLGVRGA